MIPFFKRFFRDLFFDEAAFKRWGSGVFMTLATGAIQILAYPWDDVLTWTKMEWAYRFAASVGAAIGVMMATGQKNKTVEQLHAEMTEKGLLGPTQPAPAPAPGTPPAPAGG